MTTAPIEHWPRTVMTKRRPARPIAIFTPMLTLYTAEPSVWAHGAAGDLLDLALPFISNPEEAMFTTSAINDWHELGEYGLENLKSAIRTPPRRGASRHRFEIRVADKEWAPAEGFTYHEVSETSTAVGWAQFTFDRDVAHDDVLALAIEIGHRFPMHSAVASVGMSYWTGAENTAFDFAFGWAKRYLGLDLQCPELMSQFLSDSLPSVGWLTLIGNKHERLEEIGNHLDGCRLEHDVRRMNLDSGAILLRAGAAPSLGDSHLMQYPTSIAEVATALSSFVVRTPPPFPGRFRHEDEPDATLRWLDRFVEPLAWS